MLKHKNGRFHLGHFSFDLPNDMYLNRPEMELEAGLELVSEDGSTYITFMGNDVAESALESIESIFDEEGSYTKIKEIESVTVAGFQGYKAMYQNSKSVNIECCLEITGDENYKSFTVWGRVDREKGESGIDEMLKIFNLALNQIRSNLPAERAQKVNKNEILKAPYPSNLMMTVKEDYHWTVPMPTENLTEDNIAGINHALSMLSERDQTIIRLRFEERQTLKQVGEHFGFSPENTRRRVYEALKKLRHRPCLGYLLYGLRGYEEYVSQREKEENDPYPEAIMSMTIEEMDLSIRATNCLRNAGYTHVRDIAMLTEGQIILIKNLGGKPLSEVARRIVELGLKKTNWNTFV